MALPAFEFGRKDMPPVITLNPREYDAETAVWMARFAECAYLGETAGMLQAEMWGLNYERFENIRSSGCVLGNHKFAVLCFAGTDPAELPDVVADVRFKLVPGPFHDGDRVHSGFNDYLTLVWHRAQNALVKFLRDGQRFFLCGHSLGAGMATIARARMQDRTVAGTYLFGSPRVGNRNFAVLFDHECKRVYSLTNHNDFAHWVPWMFGRYRHCGEWHYFDRNKKRWKNPNLLWVLYDKWRGCPGLLNFAGDSIGDHAISRFIDVCEGDVTV